MHTYTGGTVTPPYPHPWRLTVGCARDVTVERERPSPSAIVGIVGRLSEGSIPSDGTEPLPRNEAGLRQNLDARDGGMSYREIALSACSGNCTEKMCLGEIPRGGVFKPDHSPSRIVQM